MKPRLASLKALLQVLQHGRNLPDALEPYLSKIPAARDRALCQAIAFGVMRYYFQLEGILSALTDKPMRPKDTDIKVILLMGLYQLMHMRIPDHAAVTESVQLGKAQKKTWSAGLINGVLRNFLRQQSAILENTNQSDEQRYAHPSWLLQRFQQDWPEHWQRIVDANNMNPPMSLRVNARHHQRDQYQQKLTAAKIDTHPHAIAKWGLTLTKPCEVSDLPGFNQGHISVQDTAAQLAAPLLDPQAGDRVLDACAAPGGKTAHLLEYQSDLKRLVALDVDAERLTKVKQNLSRLGLHAECLLGDAADPSDWWDNQPFDRILLDAPCSATGVIRRHPDIKWLRQENDISRLVKTQQKILNALWPLLKPGGILLYATCSILKQENTQQITKFLTNTADASLLPIDVGWGHDMSNGRQILPGEEEMDGFFYARLQKA